MNQIYDVIVLGLGAAGLFALANLDKGINALGIEKNAAVGRKLLLTGGGRCNLTNTDNVKEMVKAYTDPSFVRPIIYGFNNLKTIDYFAQNGLELVDQNGKIYPKTERSSTVVSFFRARIAKKGHRIVYNETIHDIMRDEDHLTLVGSDRKYKCRSLIVATGGASYPQTGSDGALISKCFEIAKFEAGLCSINISEEKFVKLNGLTIDVMIKYQKRSFFGSLLFAGSALTGPVIMNLSNYVQSNDYFSVDFLPNISNEAIKALLLEKTMQHPKRRFKTAAHEVLNLPDSFINALCNQLDLLDVTLANLKSKDLNKFIDALKACKLKVKSKGALSKATVTIGGIKTTDIDNKTMQLKADDRVYVVGEAVELVGACGGYNLQFAFSSAFRAVEHLNGEKKVVSK